MSIKCKSHLSSRFLDTRVVLLLLSFIAIVCFASAITVSKEFDTTEDFEHERALEWTDQIALSSVFVSFAWTVFVLFRPIHDCLLHPGYSVGFDCFSWVYLTICALLGASFSGYLRGVRDVNSAKTGPIRSLEIVAYLCAFIMVPIHFTLFVHACRATHTRNQQLLVADIIAALEHRPCLGAPPRFRMQNSSRHTSATVPFVLDV